MTYLTIARAAFDETRKTRKVQANEGNNSASGYEINEINEKSPDVHEEGALPGLVPHPVLSGLRVYRGDVEATRSPNGWQGVAPADCGVPAACRTLGTCPGWGRNGTCPLAPITQTEATA
jgi:hypothetical protein